MTDFERAYQQLNPAQKQAVDTIEGPLLVLAGPGTGKTQLLSARAANILSKTDTLPQNILCLTFTETGAENMRERLSRFVGQTAYDITISTYHGFGSDIIGRYPQYFTATQLQNPIDTLGMHQVVQGIVDDMSYRNPLKQLRHHLGDLISTISEVKRALLSEDDLRAIANENQQFISAVNNRARNALAALSAMSRLSKQAIPLFGAIEQGIVEALPAEPALPRYGSLGAILLDELKTARQQAEDSGKTTSLTAWKNRWLAKDAKNQYVFDGELENQRITALADVLGQYQASLAARGLYDFDDMIGRAIEALEQHTELRYTLQEQYLYVMLDEFQDTNAAQLRLVELLTNNPINEGRPNVMAVGDDDQAIYAFQGAQYSNMVDFYQMYQDVQIINLTENYRSHADILYTADQLAQQIESRLHTHIPNVSKQLHAAGKLPKTATVRRVELLSDVAHYAWVASEIDRLIIEGTRPDQIAVLAPKHRYIEPLVGHLNERSIAVRYDKRENILEAPVIRQLITMCRLVLALHRGDMATADHLWPQVLSFDFWQIPTRSIWQIAWQIKGGTESSPAINWTQALLDNPACATPALLFATLAAKTEQYTCETILDCLIGSESVATHEEDMPEVRSPLRDYYTNAKISEELPELLYETVSHLRVLRTKLRAYQATQTRVLGLQDLLDFIGMYEAADERMLNTSPHSQQGSAVQLMTVFKAKGLEFDHVFMLCCQEDVWGGSSRGSSNRLTLPANLRPIRHAGATNDERLRIMYVALTRAKIGLHLASYQQTYDGRSTRRLKYLNEQEQADGSFRSLILPASSQTIQSLTIAGTPTLQSLEHDWRNRHISGLGITELRGLLQDRVKQYTLSPTHLNSFTDVQFGGPEHFFLTTILRFPQAPTPAGQYGNAIHESLEWVQHQLATTGSLPSMLQLRKYYAERLKQKRLSAQDERLFMERGDHALGAYMPQRSKQFKPTDRAEHNFRSEGVFVGEAHLGGKVDRLEIDAKNKTITVVDYKTGKGYGKWERSSKLHKYRQQLYCYKILIGGSHSFAGYRVITGRLEFVEPDSQGHCNVLELTFDDNELERTKRLIRALWQRVTNLDLPDTSDYSQDIAGILAFEDYLLDNFKD